MKSEQIAIEVGDHAGIGWSYNNIGFSYYKKGEWDKALLYLLKSEHIRIEIGDRAGLGWTYKNIGEIYSYKGELDKGLTYLLKAEQIWLEVKNRVGLGTTYFNIGIFYLEKRDKNRANEYFILAGYTAKMLGMKPEISEWSWALNPLIEEMGEERFMEEGKRLLEERMNSARKEFQNEESIEKNG